MVRVLEEEETVSTDAVAADATESGQLARRAWATDRRRRLRAGRSYSRFVEAMKVVLPAIACVLVAALIGYSALYKAPADFIKRLVGFRAEKLEMTSPILNYTDKENRTFVIKANTATQVPGGTSHWQLDTIRATMQPPDGAAA